MSQKNKVFLDKFNFIYDSPLDLDEFLCRICEGVAYKPMKDKCSHYFCQKCINTHLKSNKYCPINRAIPIKETLKECHNIEKIIASKLLYCSFKGSGCNWCGKVYDYSEHLNLCYFHNNDEKEIEVIDKEISKKKSFDVCIYDGCDKVCIDLQKHLNDYRIYHEKIFMIKFNEFKEETLKKLKSFDELLISKKRINLIEEENIDEQNESPNIISAKNSIPRRIKEIDILNSNRPVESVRLLKSITRKNTYDTVKTDILINENEHSNEIQICNNFVKVKNNVDEKYRFVFLEAHLNINSWKWIVKIIRLNGYIAFGVCFKDEIISKRYTYTHHYLHSTFVFCTDGHLWNCKNTDENGKIEKSLRSIGKGDEIEIFYDLKKSELICKFGISELKLTNVKSDALNNLTPCVIFQYPEDEIMFLKCCD